MVATTAFDPLLVGGRGGADERFAVLAGDERELEPDDARGDDLIGVGGGLVGTGGGNFLEGQGAGFFGGALLWFAKAVAGGRADELVLLDAVADQRRPPVGLDLVKRVALALGHQREVVVSRLFAGSNNRLAAGDPLGEIGVELPEERGGIAFRDHACAGRAVQVQGIAGDDGRHHQERGENRDHHHQFDQGEARVARMRDGWMSWQ